VLELGADVGAKLCSDEVSDDGVGAVAARDSEPLVFEECGRGEAGGAVGLFEGIGAKLCLKQGFRCVEATCGAFEDALCECAVGRDLRDASVGNEAEHLVTAVAPRCAGGEGRGRLVATCHVSPRVRRRVGT